MSDVVFCAVCHHKNNADSKVCSFCGSPLIQVQPAKSSTGRLVLPANFAAGLESPIKHYLTKLPENSFALFIMDDFDHPLIIENRNTIYLGRFIQAPSASFINLSDHGAAKLGVSRSHARIIWLDGMYMIEDLASTNGTWLNYQRLSFGKSYEMHNGDILLLGQLQITVCLPEEAEKQK